MAMPAGFYGITVVRSISWLPQKLSTRMGGCVAPNWTLTLYPEFSALRGSNCFQNLASLGASARFNYSERVDPVQTE